MSLLQPMPFTILREFDDYSKELSGGTMEFFEASSDVHLATYQDAEGTTANLNPVQLDQGGSAVIFLQSGKAYDIVVKDALGTQVRKLLGISVGISGTAGTSTIVANYDALRALSAAYDLVYVLGRSTTGDGGQGWFSRSTLSYADDDGICLNANAVNYKRLTNGVLDPAWYGVKYGTASDQYAALANAVNGATLWSLTLSVGGKVYLTQDLHLTIPVRILSGGGFYGSGIVFFDAGSQLLECPNRAFANSAGSCPVYFSAGATKIVNPSWFDAGDDSRLAFANASTQSSELWPTTGVTVLGWDPSTHQHNPGNTLPLSAVLSTGLTSDSADIGFSVVRPDTVNLGSGAWSAGAGWEVLSQDVSTYTLQRLKAGGVGAATLATKCKKGLTYHVAFQIYNQANDEHGNFVGTITANFDGTAIAAATTAGLTTFSQDITVQNANPMLTFTIDSAQPYTYGYITSIAITCSRDVHDNALVDATWTEGANWTGSVSSGYTHAQGSADALQAAPSLVAGHKYKGSFALTCVNPPTTNILESVTPTVASGFKTLSTTQYQLSAWAEGTYDVTWAVPTTPGTTYQLAPTFDDSVASEHVNSNGGHAYMHADHSSVGIWAGGMALEDDAFGYLSDDGGSVTAATRSFVATSATTTITLRIVCKANTVSDATTLRYGYLGSVALSLKALSDIGSLALTVGGSAVTVAQNHGVIQKSGTYTFEVIAGSSGTVVWTPTSDFCGTLSGLSLLDETLGSVTVMVGTTAVETVSETRTYVIVGSGLTGTYLSFVPSLDFDGEITNISIKKRASNAVVTLSDVLTITSDVSITAPFDPWQGKLTVTALANLTIPNIINACASPWLAYQSLDFVGRNDFGSVQAQPEWAGAIGDGAADDTIPAAFALNSTYSYAEGQYRLTENVTVGAVSLYGPLQAGQGSATSPGIRLDAGVVLTVASMALQGAAILHGNGSTIACSGAIACTSAYYSDVDSTSTGNSATCTTLSAQSSTFNVVRGIANTTAGELIDCILTGASNVYRCAPVAMILSSQRCTFTNCMPFTAADGGTHASDNFLSPHDWQMIVPVLESVTVTDSYCTGNLAYMAGANSTLNVYRLRGLDDTLSKDAVTTADDGPTRRLLTNGLGTVNEWSDDLRPRPVRNTFNGNALNTWVPMPSYTSLLWTGDTRIWGSLYSYPAGQGVLGEATQGTWYKDSSGTYHFWRPGDSPTLTSAGVEVSGNALAIHAPGTSSWELTSRASDDFSTILRHEVLDPGGRVSPFLDLHSMCFISMFGHILTVTITVPAGLHMDDELVSSFDIYDYIRHSLGSTNIREDGYASSVSDCECLHKGFVVPKSASAQTITVKLPVLHGFNPPATAGEGTEDNDIIWRGVPKLKIVGTNLDGISLSIQSSLVLPEDSADLAMFYQPDVATRTMELTSCQKDGDASGYSVQAAIATGWADATVYPKQRYPHLPWMTSSPFLLGCVCGTSDRASYSTGTSGAHGRYYLNKTTPTTGDAYYQQYIDIETFTMGSDA